MKFSLFKYKAEPRRLLSRTLFVINLIAFVNDAIVGGLFGILGLYKGWLTTKIEEHEETCEEIEWMIGRKVGLFNNEAALNFAYFPGSSSSISTFGFNLL